MIMRRALELAEHGWGRVSPNPMVGAVVVSPQGEIVGEGWYEGPSGRPHAEVQALRQADERARGATLVCTLEPCDHHGSTPPCTEALIGAGIARAVVAAGDPNPLVDGRGFDRLRAARITVETGILVEEARRLNVAYEHHMTTGAPFIVLKSAATLDGKTAAVDGSSAWITSEEARADVQRLRGWADAIVVGSRTAIQDDPRLTVRDERYGTARPPLRVLVDSAGRVPIEARLFDGDAPTLVATTDRAAGDRVTSWRAAGAEVLVLDRDVAGGVDLRGLVKTLGERDVQGMIVEGGATLAWSFVREGLVDRVVAYVAPKVLGGAAAPGVIDGAGFGTVAEALPLVFDRVERIGPDLKVEADVHRDR